jgi:hypothetical protein
MLHYFVFGKAQGVIETKGIANFWWILTPVCKTGHYQKTVVVWIDITNGRFKNRRIETVN